MSEEIDQGEVRNVTLAKGGPDGAFCSQCEHWTAESKSGNPFAFVGQCGKFEKLVMAFGNCPSFRKS